VGGVCVEPLCVLQANREPANGGLVGRKRLMISGACSASVARWAVSGGPDLLHLKLETLEWGAGFQHLEIVEPLWLTVGWPYLHSALLGQQKPAEAGTIALIDVHLPAQSRDTE